MKQDFTSLVEHYHQKKIEGMDFSDIRKELKEKGIDEKVIKQIVGEIDNKLLAGEVSKAPKFQPKHLRLLGWFFMIVGGGITLANYLHYINLKTFYILSYGPVIIGYLLIVAARRAQNRK